MLRSRKPASADMPTWNILLLLLVHVGAPYLMLSSTGPLLQSWFIDAESNHIGAYYVYADLIE